jgi:hypothetical protein
MAKPPIELRVNGRRITTAQFREFITSLPRNVRGPATERASKFLAAWFKASDSTQPYRHITRREAYSNSGGHDAGGWKSDKQRRFVMAKISRGEITPGRPNRTGEIAGSWDVAGRGVDAIVYNDAPGVAFVHGNAHQANQIRMAGWPTVDELIEDGIDECIDDMIGFVADNFKKQMNGW